MYVPNKIALITGATSGIGAAFAKKFASQNYDLIITGRREEKISTFADELRSKYKVNIEVIICELSNDQHLELLFERVKNLKNLAILVNNAGFAVRNKFHEENFTVFENMIKVHVLATIKLTHAALPNMISNNEGIIINVSSIMAFFPFPRNSMYTATKAFINLFTESINLELKNTGVRVQVLCPGLTLTDFHEKMGLDTRELAKKPTWLWQPPMLPERVVEISLRCLAKNKVICIPGIFNKLIVIMYTLRRLF
jgi:short-subunit dehydrogenase